MKINKFNKFINRINKIQAINKSIVLLFHTNQFSHPIDTLFNFLFKKVTLDLYKPNKIESNYFNQNTSSYMHFQAQTNTQSQSQKQYISIQRQQKLIDDIQVVFQLFSSHKQTIKKNKQEKNKNINSKIKSIYQNKNNINEETDQQNSIKIINLKYEDLMFILGRKKINNKLIKQFLNQKYAKITLNQIRSQQLRLKLTEMMQKSPQITLFTCLMNNWYELMSGEDVFNDITYIVSTNISCGWKANTIKVSQRNEFLPVDDKNQLSRIDKNVNHLNDPPQKVQNKHKVIQTQTRQILDKLSKLKQEMDVCQAEMNIAKNNQDRIIEQNKQYLKRKRQYQSLKEKYRRKTIQKGQKQIEKSINKETKGHKQTFLTQAVKQGESRVRKQVSKLQKNITGSLQNQQLNQLKKITTQFKAQIKQLPQDQHIQNTDKKDHQQLLKSQQQKTIKAEKSSQSQVKLQQIQPISHNQFRKYKNINKLLASQEQKSSTKQQYHSKMISVNHDEIIQILELKHIQNLKQQRLKYLSPKIKVKSPLQNSNNSFYQNSPMLQSSSFQISISPFNSKKSINRKTSRFMHSQKQQLFEKYIKRVFNLYVLEQSKDNLPFFKKQFASHNMSKSLALNQNQIQKKQSQIQASQYKSKNRSLSGSQLIEIKKKLSLNLPYSSQNSSLLTIPQKRKLTINHQNLLSKNQSNQNRFKTLPDSSSMGLPQMNIESFSKFIKAFQLASKNITFNQIIKLFKQKSINKKSINYTQFIELFQLIYRFQCQKLNIQFTPIMFDAYLNKQILNWGKINKVLRLNPTQLNDIKGQKNILQTKCSSKLSSYKFSVSGHTGKLSQQIQQKINASRKPFIKMPCMNLPKTKIKLRKYKTISNQSQHNTSHSNDSQEHQEPKSKIQIKVQQINKARLYEKQKYERQLAHYKSVQFENMSQSNIIEEQRNNEQSELSYFKRYNKIDNRKKFFQQRKNPKNIMAKKIKIKEQQDNNYSQQINNQSASQIKRNKKGKVRTETNQMQGQINQLYFQGNKSKKNHLEQVEDQIRKQKLKNRNQGRKQIAQLQKLIGIISSSDNQDDQLQSEQSQQQNVKKNKNHDQINQSRYLKSSRYQTINCQSKPNELKGKNKNNPKQQYKEADNEKYQQRSNVYVSEGSPNRKNTQIATKRQEDEYLKKYLVKQYPINQDKSHQILHKFNQNVYKHQQPSSQSTSNKDTWKKFFVHY